MPTGASVTSVISGRRCLAMQCRTMLAMGLLLHVSHSDMQGIMRRMSSQEAGALGRRLSSQEASGRLSMDSSILGGARYPRYTCWSGLRRVSLCAVSSARWSLCLASTVSWSECVQALA